MASGRDVRDIFGLPAGGDAPKAPVQQRKKSTAPARKIQGVAREVAALYGERPPPVAVYEEKKTYRAKRQSTGPAKKWIQEPFTNQARSDGLVLRHWARADASIAHAASGDDTTMEDGSLAVQPVVSIDKFAKFNVEVPLPEFSDEEYANYLSSPQWSREETDYLLRLVKEYAHRWAVIWDRYDYQPSTPMPKTEAPDGDSTALAALPFAPPKTPRTVEDLKARFYSISAALMKLRIPEVHMDAEQYAHYEMLKNFDPQLERNRKELAAQLMTRGIDECKEEEFLLVELQRINMQANRLEAERNELRARLESPVPNVANQLPGLQAFQSSQALSQLFNQLFQADKSKKRQSGAAGAGSQGARLSLSNEPSGAGTPTSAQQQALAASRRHSVAQPAQQAPTPLRQLTPHQEHRFNVSTHDRLTSGVSFGTDKLLKMRQAKSNVQTQKIATALQELAVPEIIPIPTTRVADVFEGLVSKVSKLTDARKLREKEEGECRVLEAMKKEKGLDGSATESRDDEKQEGEPPASATDSGRHNTAKKDQSGDHQDRKTNTGANDEQGAEPDADGDNDSPATVGARVTGHKRSASVLSQGSNKDTKKARK